MTSAQIIDGKAFAAVVRQKVAEKVRNLEAAHDIIPGLAVVLVGSDPASQVYVRSKGKQTVEVGMNSFEHRLDADTSEDVLLALIDATGWYKHHREELTTIPDVSLLDPRKNMA